MHSDSESTLISPRADQFGSTLPPLDKRAQDKNEGGEEGTIPPPLFKRNPEDNDGVDWRQVTDPDLLAKMHAHQIRREERREARAAQAISSSAHLSGAKPKQIKVTGSSTGQKVQEKNTAPKEDKLSSALEKTTLLPLGVESSIPTRDKNEEETQLLILGHFGTQRDKFESDKFTTAVMNKEEQDSLLDNWSEDWTFPSDNTTNSYRSR
jgi:hypothetical protein